jgi:hypothetical protein
VHADNPSLQAAKVTKAFRDDDFLRIAPHLPHPPDWLDLAPSDFLVSCFLFGISKTTSKDSNSNLQMNFFRESKKFWTKSALEFWTRFSGSESTDWTDALQHCSKWEVRVMKCPTAQSVILDSAQIWRWSSDHGASDIYFTLPKDGIAT